MAKTQNNKKIVPVKPHVRRTSNGKRIKVRGHRRSTPN